MSLEAGVRCGDTCGTGRGLGAEEPLPSVGGGDQVGLKSKPHPLSARLL